MGARRIILFRFDREPRVCRSRVRLLRKVNPGVPVHGLFGGPRGYKRLVFRIAGRAFLDLDDLYVSGVARLSWNQIDPVLTQWYLDIGRELDFDVAHLIEWDLLFAEPLHKLYEHVPTDAVGLTACTPLSQLDGQWEWLNRAATRREWERLLFYVQQEWGYAQVPHACLGGGPVFPRRFLSELASLQLPRLTTEEFRLPLAAQILGYPIVDTGLTRGWFNPAEDRFFNLNSEEIDRRVIAEELRNPAGRRAFHPVRTIIYDLAELAPN
jgi:hypothetical protein